MINPCLCVSLQTGTKVLGVIDLVIGLLFLFLSTIGLINVLEAYKQQDERISFLVASVVIVVAISASLFSIILAIILLIGAFQKKISKCKFWIYVNMVLLVIYVINTIVTAAESKVIYIPLIGILHRIYMLWVVWAFMVEVKCNELAQF